ncbi:hypothetical protein [Oceanobacillus sp. CAU 1775]
MNNKQNNDDEFERFMNIENQDPAKRFQIIHNESMEKKEYNPDTIPVFHQPKKKKRRNSSAFLLVLFTVLAASMIGLLYGYGALHMFAFMDDDTTASVEVKEVSQPVSVAETESTALPELSGYVLQAGVFSTEENAIDWQVNTLPDHIPSFIWEQDTQYYLFSGIFETEELAKIKASEYQDTNLEFYTKKWTTTNSELQLTTEEKVWLEELLAVWNSTIMVKDQTAFGDLTQKIPASTTLGFLSNYLKSNENKNNDEFYLEIMYLYNQLGN